MREMPRRGLPDQSEPRRIETAATRLLGVNLPVVQAGMSWASSHAALPSAVSRAGGLGVLALGPMRLADIAPTVDEIRAQTAAPFAVNLPLYRHGVEDVVELLLQLRPPVLIASQGGPGKHLARFHEVGTKWLHVVASQEHALKATDAGVDGLVVVGGESGGHPPPSGVSTLVLARSIALADTGLPLIAAGGFVDGAGLAAGLALGADAVQFGTRFLATEEANVHAAYKEAVLGASIVDTRMVGAGLGVIRVLDNEFARRMEALELDAAEIEDRRAVFQAATLKMAALDGNVASGKVEAGQSAGLIDAILPAGDVVTALVEEYLEALERLPRPSQTPPPPP